MTLKVRGAKTIVPTFVLIVADDLGYRELGCFGQQRIKTPHLDQLAKQGLRLTQHYSGNAVCAPSRCVLMTGKHPGHAYIRNNRSTPPEGQQPIPDREVTLAEVFQSVGYATGGFGKWGLGGPRFARRAVAPGIRTLLRLQLSGPCPQLLPGLPVGRRCADHAEQRSARAGACRPAGGGRPSRSAELRRVQRNRLRAGDRINEQALEFVRANKDRPFFLYYPTIIPHIALHVPDEELKPYLNLGWNDPPFTREGGGYTPHFTPRAAYAAMISRMDRYVGNLLQLLDELGLADNTVVVFTSDNGTTHVRQEVDYEFFNSVGELRGLKGSLYEGGVRVPTIVRWPGRVPAGETSDRVSGFEDWLPTLLELAGESDAVPVDIDGISAAPTLLGNAQQPRPYLYREFTGYGGQQSIRVGDWKAVRQDMARGNVEIELYNLANDVGEQTDVAQEHPELVAKLAGLMEKHRTPSELFPLRPIDPPTHANRAPKQHWK